MLISTKGFVIHQVKYGESSSIVQIFTHLHGMVRVMIRGSRGKNSKAALLQSLNKVELIYYRKENFSLYNIKEIRTIKPYDRLITEPERIAQLMFIAEVFYRCIKEEEQNIELFELLEQMLETYDKEAFPNPDFHLAFILKLATRIGIQPVANFDKIDRPYLNIQDAIYQSHFQNNCLDKQVSEVIHHFSENEYNGLLIMNGSLRRKSLEGILDYFKLQFPSIGTIRSHEILEQVFH